MQPLFLCLSGRITSRRQTFMPRGEKEKMRVSESECRKALILAAAELRTDKGERSGEDEDVRVSE